MIDEETKNGQTPLDPNEIEGLILLHITTRGELDRWEHDNIVDALDWLERRRPKSVLDEIFLRELHRRMFGKVWRWAGKFRLSEKNLGIPFHQIAIQLRQLLDDTNHWIDHQTYPPDEIAVRFHHRLVSSHPFPNGNGRHARLMTDLLLQIHLEKAVFSWGTETMTRASEIRRVYIEALRDSDEQDYKRLLEFVRS